MWDIAVKVTLLCVASVVFIIVCGWAWGYLQGNMEPYYKGIYERILFPRRTVLSCHGGAA